MKSEIEEKFINTICLIFKLYFISLTECLSWGTKNHLVRFTFEFKCAFKINLLVKKKKKKTEKVCTKQSLLYASIREQLEAQSISVLR